MHISTPRPVHRDVAFRYHLKNRFNPLHAYEKVAVLETRKKFFLFAIAACLVVSLISAILIWFLTRDSPLGSEIRIGAIMLPSILLGALCVRLTLKIYKEHSQRRELISEIEIFDQRYRAFLETVGLTPVNIDHLTDKKIEKLCEELLGTEARATATRSARGKKTREKKLGDIYQAVTHIGYGNKSLEDYLKRAKRKPRVKKIASRRAKA